MPHILSIDSIPIEEKQPDFSNAQRQAEALEAKYSEKQKSTEPLPLQREVPPPEPFPIRALGRFMDRAAQSTHFTHRGRSDLICGGSFFIYGVSLCSGPQRRGHWKAPPTSEFFLTVATSGDRKSTADKQALKSIHAYQREVLESGI